MVGGCWLEDYKVTFLSKVAVFFVFNWLKKLSFCFLLALLNSSYFSAPLNVFVAGNMNVTEGNNINLSCEHQSEFPASNGSLFLFNGTETYVDEVKNALRLCRFIIAFAVFIIHYLVSSNI